MFRKSEPEFIQKENLVPYLVLALLWIFLLGSMMIYFDVLPYPDLPISAEVTILTPISFSLFVFVFYCSLVFFRRTSVGVSRKKMRLCNDYSEKYPGYFFSFRYSFFFLILMLFVSLFLLWFNLFYSGGLDVIRGEVGRGVYRRQQLGLGPLDQLFKNYFPKAILSASVFVVFSSKYSFLNFLILLFVTILTGAIALSTGFKGSLIFYFAPAVTVFVLLKFRSFNFYHILFLLVSAIAFALGTTLLLFGADSAVLQVLFHRILAIPVGMPIWFAENYFFTGSFIEYFPTLVYALGGTIVGLVIARNQQEIVDLNFSWKITSLSGYDVSSIADGGHTNTATVVGEALFAGGFVGVLLFAVLCAVFSLVVGRVILWASFMKRGALLIVLSVYLWNNFIPWINAGGVTRLFDLNYFFNLMVVYFVFFVIFSLRNFRRYFSR